MLSIDLTGKRAFVAGIADDKGYGWAIARALAEAGASICVGTWPPTMRIFTKSLERGKLDVSLPGGGEIELYTGTTDNPDDHVPTFHIWHDERIKWLETVDNLPRYHRWAHDGSKPYLHGPAGGDLD